MKVKIVKCTNSRSWYLSRIGEEFDVDNKWHDDRFYRHMSNCNCKRRRLFLHNRRKRGGIMYKSLRDKSKELKSFEKAQKLGLETWQEKNVAEEVEKLEKEVYALEVEYDRLNQD